MSANLADYIVRRRTNGGRSRQKVSFNDDKSVSSTANKADSTAPAKSEAHSTVLKKDLKPKTEAKPHVDAPKSKTNQEVTPKAQPHVKEKAAPKLESKPEVKPLPEEKPKVQPKPEVSPKVEPKPEVSPKVEPKPEVSPKVEPRPEAKTNINPQPKSDVLPKTEPKSEIVAKPEVQPEPQPKVEAKPQPKPKLTSELKTEVVPEPKVEVAPIPKTEEAPKLEPKAKPVTAVPPEVSQVKPDGRLTAVADPSFYVNDGFVFGGVPRVDALKMQNCTKGPEFAKFFSWLTNGREDDILDAYNVLFGS